MLLIIELELICHVDSWVTHNKFGEHKNQSKQRHSNCKYLLLKGPLLYARRAVRTLVFT